MLYCFYKSWLYVVLVKIRIKLYSSYKEPNFYDFPWLKSCITEAQDILCSSLCRGIFLLYEYLLNKSITNLLSSSNLVSWRLQFEINLPQATINIKWKFSIISLQDFPMPIIETTLTYNYYSCSLNYSH